MARFSSDEACADYLARKRWPGGFVCPDCGSMEAWELRSKNWTWHCAGCGKQTSVTAGTAMHGSKVPLRTWFLAAHLLATHSNSMSALQLQAKLGLGSYKTAWLLLHKLRRAMVVPGRNLLSGDVEVDETSIVFRTKDDPVGGGQGRSPVGKIVVMGAVELLPGNMPGRIRLSVVPDFTRATAHRFVRDNIEPGSHIWTDGNQSYFGLNGYGHTVLDIRNMQAHILMPWIHRVFSNLKRWGMGTLHGFRPKYLDAYLNEFVFRWNRRRSYPTTFDRLVGVATELEPKTRQQIMATRAPRRRR